LLHDHIHQVAGHFRETVFTWDVVNEALSDDGDWREESTWFQLIGPDYLDYAFRWTREAAPAAILVYNDYGMEHANAKADGCVRLLDGLRARGVPVDAVGFQFHLGAENRMDPHACAANLRRFRERGFAIQFTEMDMGIKRPVTEALRAAQAEEYATRVRIGLEAGVTAIIFWGFTDKYSWIPAFTKDEYAEPLLFTPDYAPKPAYAAIRAALAE
jgi:endo-1,4-beta-xylanase